MINRVIKTKHIFLLSLFSLVAFTFPSYAMEENDASSPVATFDGLQKQIERLQRELAASLNKTLNAQAVIKLRDGLIETIRGTSSVLQLVIDGLKTNLCYRNEEIDRLRGLETENFDLNAEIIRLNLLLLQVRTALGQERATSAELRAAQEELDTRLIELSRDVEALTTELQNANGNIVVAEERPRRHNVRQLKNFALLWAALVIIVLVLKLRDAAQGNGHGHVPVESVNAAREALRIAFLGDTS